MASGGWHVLDRDSSRIRQKATPKERPTTKSQPHGCRLTIRHDAGKGAAPYVNGTLLAARRVMQVTGLVRGLDRLLFRE